MLSTAPIIGTPKWHSNIVGVGQHLRRPYPLPMPSPPQCRGQLVGAVVALQVIGGRLDDGMRLGR